MKIQQTWNAIEKWLEAGLSVIPVRDKKEGTRPAKTPYNGWKQYQSEIIDKGILFQQMEYYNTNAVAVITGSVSGNLEIIDIDSKYNHGFDAVLFADIEKFYPLLWERLRIHKTPSGGYHILYRTTQQPDGNKNLASRNSTDEEIAQDEKDGKRPRKTRCFLETRGQGGYALLPPSMGYAVIQDVEIPLITWEERCSLISLCKTYDQTIKVEPTPSPRKVENDAYSKNPFEDYNERCDPNQLMTSLGWKWFRENNTFIWYDRPRYQGEESGVSASYNKSKGVFFMFTSSVGIDNDRGYNPSSLLAEFQFNGDKKACFKWLVQNGFGEHTKRFEQATIKNAVISGKASLPENFSQEAKEQFAKEQEIYKSNHPFGVFWQLNDKGKYVISREEFYTVAESMGFRNHLGDIVQLAGRFIYKFSPNDFYDLMKDYIKEEEAELYIDICNGYESFIQSSGSFSISRIASLETDGIISDSQSECYKFYNDVAVRITPSAIRVVQYDDIEGLIWADKILHRDYPKDSVKSSGLYETFLKNSTGFSDDVKNIIGYLCHDYKSEATGYIVVMTETVLDSKDGGGSGKNIFGNMLRNMITVCTVPGSSVKFDNSLLQSWNGERIYFLADIPKKIDWAFLKEFSSGYGLLKKLYKNEVQVNPEDMPKFLLNTNYSYDDADGGLKRRIKPIEFTPFYTLKGGVDAVHGKMFPSEFTKEDWADFDRIVLDCIRYNLSKGGKIETMQLSKTGWEKKFKSTYTTGTYDFIHMNIDMWVEQGFVSNNKFKEQYNDFANENDIQHKYRATSILMNIALKEYCDRMEIVFSSNERSQGGRGRRFTKNEDCPF